MGGGGIKTRNSSDRHIVSDIGEIGNCCIDLVNVPVDMPMVGTLKIEFSQKEPGFGVIRTRLKNSEILKGFH